MCLQNQNALCVATTTSAFLDFMGSNSTGVNPVLTVALTPVPKVDYSVTKGGARTWIVLLVFIFLCSSLYTIFSAKDAGDSHHDLSSHSSADDDDVPAYNHPGSATEDDDDDDDDDEPPTPSPRVSKKQEQQTTQQKTTQPAAAQVTDSDDEDDEESNEHTLGGRLFAGLRKKITDRLNEKAVKEEPKSKNDQILNPRELRKLKKQQKTAKVEVVEDDDDDDDEDDDDVEAPAPQEPSRKQKAHNQREEKKDKNKKYQPVKEEPDLDDDDDDEDDDDDDGDDDDDEKDDGNDAEKDDGDDDDDDDDGNDDDEEDGKNKKTSVEAKSDKVVEEKNDGDDEPHVSHREAQRLRRQHLRESRRDNRPRQGGNRECIHQDCPNRESLKPRKSLLVTKKKTKSMVERILDDEFDDEDDDDEDDDSEVNKNDREDDDEDDVDERISDRDSSSSYKRHAITTKEEIGFRDILDRADNLVEKHQYEEAMELFDHVIAVYPASTRAYFGKARAYDIRGEIEADETDRDKAIEIYEKILQNSGVPDALFRQAAQRLIEKTRFRGQLHKTLTAHRYFIDRFPEELNLQTDFAISFVMMKRYEDARTVLKNVLANDPNHVIALAYYGYILKAHDDKVEQGVALMRKSLKNADNEITDPKFYYQLGHGLTTLGRKSEADAVYQKAAQMGVFMTAQQRSLYNIEGLTGRAWWAMDQTPYSKFLKTVERQWATIRQEGMEVLKDCSDCWLDHNQQLVIDGQWKFFPIMSEQNFIKSSCERMPQTCLILQEFAASSNASKSDMHLSVLSSGASILPHCGPTNYHLQAHLGLVSPSEARIRVGNETKGWRSGKFIIYDDSFEHELQFDGASSSSFRLVLTIQLWHPEVQPHQRVLSFLS
eukprot:NP_001123164.1 Uncharacterized protein CELE_K09A9.6 [Caenorhabditis elegans]